MVWQQTLTQAEVTDLRDLERDRVLADQALRARLRTSDASAAPLLRQRLRKKKWSRFWWHEARGIGLNQLKEEVAEFMADRRQLIAGGKQRAEADYILAELLMDRRDTFAAQTLIDNWDHLAGSSYFVQAALYMATPKLICLAQEAIEKSDSISELLKYMDMHWGVKMFGRPGITDRAQLEALTPYLIHLDEGQLCSLFEAANSLGELEWRRTYIDPHMARIERGYCAGDSHSIFRSLDKAIQDDGVHRDREIRAHWWFERREKELCNRQQLLGLITEWSRTRSDVESAHFLLSAIAEFGERGDLKLLQTLNSDILAAVEDRISNCS